VSFLKRCFRIGAERADIIALADGLHPATAGGAAPVDDGELSVTFRDIAERYERAVASQERIIALGRKAGEPTGKEEDFLESLRESLEHARAMLSRHGSER
jgi:hypothetical protein